MSHKPVTGLSTLNRVLAMPFKLVNKISKWPVPVPKLHHDQNRLLYLYSKYFIVRDLELLFSRLRNEDQLVSADVEHLNELDPAVI